MGKLVKWFMFNMRYLWNAPWDTGITPPEVKGFIDDTAPGRALDLGAGTGTNLITLARAGWEAVGVDFALIAVIKARIKIKRAGVNARIFLHDVTDLSFLQGKFDLVLDIGCYHALREKARERYRKNLLKVLTSGGTYLVYGFLAEETNNSVGISEREIDQFSKILQPISINKGTERGKWGSVWMNFRKA